MRQLAASMDLSPAQIDRMHGLHGRHRVLAAGDTLFHLGESEQALFVSRRGSFKSVAMNEVGDEQVIAFHLPGELIGLDALGSSRHRCQAVALEVSEVCELNMAQLEQAARDVPGLQHSLLRLLGHMVEVDQDHLALLGRPQAIERMAMFLIGLLNRLQSLGLAHEQLTLPMSRAEIASYLGLVIETVSRSFGRLQEGGLLKVSGRSLKILDLPGLRQLAHCTAADPPTRGQRRA